MFLPSLLARARPLLETRLQEVPPVLSEAYPACTLVFSLCDGNTRAQVCHASGGDFLSTWKAASSHAVKLAKRTKLKVKWLRIDWVTSVEAATWESLNARLAETKRNYFRHGLALDAGFNRLFLEQELNANAMLYGGDKVTEACLNPGNFTVYAATRYGKNFFPDFSPAAPVYVLSTEGLFVAVDGALTPLPGGQTPQWLAGPGLEGGRRHLSQLAPDQVFALLDSGANFLAKQVQKDGQFVYGHFPCFGRRIPTYNALRHASSIYALLEAWELTRREAVLASIRLALNYLVTQLIRSYTVSNATEIAFLVDTGGEIKLGANAVSLLALVKYQELTGDTQYLPLMEKLALGIRYMQNRKTGRFVHVLHAADLSVKEAFRIIYYDGEAAFGLMRLYGVTRDPRWLAIVELAFGYFLQADHWKAHDHWLSYCANELTQYKPEEKYFRFGVRNISGYLDFIEQRETTFPTLLELSMAFERMLMRLRDLPSMRHVLRGLDVEKFYRAMHRRAHHLLNGFFWPEMAMFFAKPSSILGSFFIRHHAFRVRIDDIEHYLSGYVAYWKYLQRNEPELSSPSEMEVGAPVVSPEELPEDGPVVVWGGDLNLGRRQHYRTAELGVEKVLRVPALKEADLSIINLECVISTRGEQGLNKGEGGPYYLRARPEMMRVLVASGIDLVATANNHCGDYGPEALLEQNAWLDALGIAHVGSGATFDEALQPAIRRAGNLNVAVFGLDATQHRFAAGPDQPGSAHLSLSDPQVWKEKLAPRIAAVRDRVHVVLVTVHWGHNYEAEPTTEKMAVGHAIIDAGADGILGASAHQLQGVEIYRGRPIIYDAGNLLFDTRRADLGDTGVFRLVLSADGVKRVTFVPVGTGYGFSVQRTGREAMVATRRYAAQCKALGTVLQMTPSGTGIIELSPESRAAPECDPAPTTRYNLAAIEKIVVPPNPAWQVGAVPKGAAIPPVQMGPLTLLGMRVKPLKLTRRRMVWVETFWQARVKVEEDIRLLVQAAPVSRTKMPVWGLGMDHDPCDWMIPTSRWQPGVIYRDYYGVRAPQMSDLENIDLQIRIGLVSKVHAVKPIALPFIVKMEIPGKDPGEPAPDQNKYRTVFPPIIHQCAPGQTWTAEQLAAVTGGEWLVPPPKGWFVRSVVAASKHIPLLPAPVMYAAHNFEDRMRHEEYTRMAGLKWDRHQTMGRLVGRVVASIVSRPVPGLPADFPLLQVDDPIKAVIELGIAARERFRNDVIAITGTVGKSTTSMMLHKMLAGDDRVLVSVDNYNTRVGAPAMLANLAQDREAAIIEIAQSALWMKRGPVTRLVKPTVALITEIGVSQTDRNVKTVQDTASYKSRIFDGLTGPAVAILGEHLNCFDYLLDVAKKYAKRVIVFGRSERAEVRILGMEAHEEGSLVELETPTGRVQLPVPVPGEGMAHNAVAAFCVVYATGRDFAACVERFKDFASEEGRLQRLQLPWRGDGVVDVIDDSWNATVASMLNAFLVFGAAPARARGRKVAVLGRIVHLGELARSLHESLAEPLLATGVGLVVTHGEEMEHLRRVLPEALLGPHFKTASRLVAYLQEALRADDLVLIKGSRRDSDFGNTGTLLKACAAEWSGKG
ncbi:MAG: CapA family protein [Magnetococcales bacterium]|nr:CapA family protein [Magnetococcales bacterium]